MKDIAINTILKQIPITTVILHTHVGIPVPVPMVVPSLGEGSCLCLQSVGAASASPNKQGQSQDQDLSAGPRTDPSLSLMQYSGVQESCASQRQTEIINKSRSSPSFSPPQTQSQLGLCFEPCSSCLPPGLGEPCSRLVDH